jgi:hypothetical protein
MEFLEKFVVLSDCSVYIVHQHEEPVVLKWQGTGSSAKKVIDLSRENKYKKRYSPIFTFYFNRLRNKEVVAFPILTAHTPPVAAGM